jgi:hypothetical protein
VSAARAANLVALTPEAPLTPTRPTTVATWAQISASAPQLAATMKKYLAQIAVS